MESWLQRVFLTALITALGTPALAQSADQPNRTDQRRLDDVIDPGLERRRIREDRIDSENFEAGLFGGIMNVEDFGSNDVYGVRFAYHITEDFFLEAAYAQTETSKTSYETLSGAAELLTESQRDLSYYNLSLGFTLLPGEVFIAGRAFNTNYYLIGGAGNTLFADDEYFTYNFGGGFRFFATDWLALRVDFRNHIFSHSLLGDEKETQNLEGHFGATIYF